MAEINKDNKLRESMKGIASELNTCSSALATSIKAAMPKGEPIKIEPPQFGFSCAKTLSEVSKNQLGSVSQIASQMIKPIILPKTEPFKIVLPQFDFSYMRVFLESVNKQLEGVARVAEVWRAEFDEAVIRERKDNISQWAKFGWVISDIGGLSFSHFYEKVESQETADELMSKYVDGEFVDELCDDLRGLKKKDNEYQEYTGLEESIFCFQHKKYISCINTLLPLFDTELIRHQLRKEEGVRAQVGAKAAQKLKKHFETDNDDFAVLTNYLSTGVISYLELIFEDAKNFTIPQTHINRNLPLHGMNKKAYSELDCLKLFNAYRGFAMLMGLHE